MNEANDDLIDMENLVGKHLLSGVDMFNREVKQRWGNSFEDCQCINFVLDGIPYTAIEDPSDGYRSSLDKIIKSNEEITNTFSPVEVVIHIQTERDGYWGGECKILTFIDTKNGKTVLCVGTDNSDDYYPSFVSDWMPENLSLNDDSEAPHV